MSTADPALHASAFDDDPFRYGWKEERVRLSDGTTKLQRIPLTPEDVLHPEEHYTIMNTSRHGEECRYLWDVIATRLASNPSALVLSDTGIYWDDPFLEHHCPDVAVIFGVREQRDNWTSFDVGEQEARPVLMIEIVSPHVRENDTEKKVKEYHRAKVPWYVIVDRIQNEGPPTLIGLRYAEGGYVEFAPDPEGRILLEPVGLKLGVKENRVALFDAVTGKEQGNYQAIADALGAEQTARVQAEERAAAEQAARTQAEQRAAAEEKMRVRAEQQAAEEHFARGQAELRAEEEQAARAQAEQRVRELAELEAAQTRAAQEAIAARKAMEEQLAAVMKQLQLLQGAGPDSPAPG
jgi:Uma2 family endonuclease